MNKTNRIIMSLIVAIAFFLPFERIGSFSIAGFTIRITQILYLLILGIFFLQTLFRQKKILLQKIYIPLFLFFAAILLSLLNTPNFSRSIMILMFVVFTSSLTFIIPQYLKTKKQIKKILFIILLSTIMVSLFGLFQFAGDMLGLPPEITGLRDQYTKDILGFSRVQSTALEPLYFANFLLIPLCISLSLLLSKKENNLFSKKFLSIVFLLGIINLVLTSSRGGYISFAISALLIGIYFFKNLFTLKNVIYVAICALFIYASVTFALNLYTEDPLKSTFSKFSYHITTLLDGAAFDERKDTFLPAIEQFKEHPIIGNGIGSYGPLMSPTPYDPPEKGFPIVNNITLEVLSEIGVLGLISLFIFIYFVFLRSIRVLIKPLDTTNNISLQIITIALSVALAGIIIQYQTFSTLYIFHIWFLIGLILSVQNILMSNNKTKPTA